MSEYYFKIFLLGIRKGVQSRRTIIFSKKKKGEARDLEVSNSGLSKYSKKCLHSLGEGFYGLLARFDTEIKTEKKKLFQVKYISRQIRTTNSTI